MKLAKHLKKTGKSLRGSLSAAIESAPPELRKPAQRILLAALFLFIGITVFKFIQIKREEYERASELAAGPRLRAAKVTQTSGEHDISVIGETRPYQSVTLYAKVSGYLKDVRVDKGDHVKQKQILAVIESPETDQAYSAALANSKNKHDIAVRMTTLLKQGLVSQQEAEQAQSDDEVAGAQFRSQEILKGYEILRAPFDGTVTARFADAGALVQNATSAQTSALPLVTVSQLDTLRVDIFLDQREAPFVRIDEPVEITVSERAGLKIKGRVNRRSDQLDPRTKMMLTEIDIPNREGNLVAGSFVQVSLKIRSLPYLEAPVESLILRQNKPFLTVVTPESLLTYKPVEVVSNNGKSLLISSGVQAGDSVALNVGETIPEGSKVRVIPEGKEAK